MKPNPSLNRSFTVWDTRKITFRADQRADSTSFHSRTASEGEGMPNAPVSFEDLIGSIPERMTVEEHSEPLEDYVFPGGPAHTLDRTLQSLSQTLPHLLQRLSQAVAVL